MLIKPVYYPVILMRPGELNFSFWKDSIAGNPVKAAQKFFARVNSIHKDERKASLSCLASEKTITESFDKAVELLDLPLGGIPFMLKDLFDVAGYPTHCSSTLLLNLRSAPDKSCLLFEEMSRAGAIFCGKTHMNEFAYGLDGLNIHFGDCPHPKFPDRLSGGSSSGSAWAVGKGLTPLAFGTDTGGSIRVPASFCGIYGLRLCPHQKWVEDGCFPLAPTFDTAGWFTSNAEDMKTCIQTLISPVIDNNNYNFRGLYFEVNGVPIDDDLKKNYHQMADRLRLEKNGVAQNDLSTLNNNIEKHYAVLQSREAYSVHQQWLDDYREQYDPAVWQRIDRGRHWKKEEVQNSENQQEKIRSLLNNIFADFDYLAMPAVPCPAVKKGNLSPEFREGLLRLNSLGSMAGLPVLTIPIFLANGLSGGLQIIYPNLQSQLPLYILDQLIAM